MNSIDKNTHNTTEPETSLKPMNYTLKKQDGIIAGFQKELGILVSIL